MTPTPWRSRIVGHGEAPPDHLTSHPRNWRRHPRPQLDALSGLLDDVGFVQDVIQNTITGHLIDGHARVALAVARGEPTVPVVYVELTPEEEQKVLVSFDPIGAMATADRETLERLLGEVSTDDAGLRTLLRGLAEHEGITPPDFQPATLEEQGRLDQRAPLVCPACGHEFVPG